MSYSGIASLQWYFTGLFNYGSWGYRKSSKKWAQTPLDDLSSNHYIVTGANSGIGFAIATKLAQLGANVHLVCRNPSRAQTAREEILSLTHTDANKVIVHIADLSKQNDVKALAAELSSAVPVVHGLINNAGFLTHQATFTEDDVESTMAIAINGTYLLTALLLPQLAKSNGVGRVINMSSGGQYLGTLDPNDVRGKTRVEKFDGTLAYMLAKKTQVALTQCFAKRFPLDKSNVVFHAVNPGWATTPGTEAGIPTFNKIHGFMMRTPEEAADTVVWLATAKEPATSSGFFWMDRQQVSTEMSWANTAPSSEDVEQLWSNVVEICGYENE
ncbi:dehydrogenase/reductase SDR family member 12-like [Thraustotheca clavata]|uniref:Dehydrogenase/reductase SDR family member 12-like n=1 Tax=Thraustotheca clavata TaxID=74557 RepID=A0A1V9ZAM3_9STRA|nr:dehydrogenase/reductase SDR family member 12-like [Thraustotheca clavata]